MPVSSRIWDVTVVVWQIFLNLEYLMRVGVWCVAQLDGGALLLLSQSIHLSFFTFFKKYI